MKQTTSCEKVMTYFKLTKRILMVNDQKQYTLGRKCADAIIDTMFNCPAYSNLVNHFKAQIITQIILGQNV